MTVINRESEIFEFLRTRLAEVTQQDASSITEASVLIDLGLQSIDAVLLCGEVEDRFDIELDPAIIFEHDTLGGFAGEIDRLLEAK